MINGVRGTVKISVAMATYNGERFIGEQLLSLVNQIRQPDEVVIVDDCSTDNTVSVIKSFIEENNLLQKWKIYINGENLGYKRNFKKALSLTSGDIVFLCDQDDIWCEDKLESIAKLFSKNPNMLAINSSFFSVDSFGKTHGYEKNRGKNNYGLIDFTLKKPLTKIPLSSVFHKNISPGCTQALTKELVKEYVDKSECYLPHDHELNLLAAKNGGLWFYDAPLIKYRLHESNTIGFTVKKVTRIEIAKDKCASARAINHDGKNADILKMCELRLKAHEEISLVKMLKLWFMPSYYRFFPIRERVGDLLYIFGRR